MVLKFVILFYLPKSLRDVKLEEPILGTEWVAVVLVDGSVGMHV